MKNDLAQKWDKIQAKLSAQFADNEQLDLDGILFLIGVQELGLGFRKFNKSEKMDIMHIAICKVLSRYSYYTLEGLDDEGWPHYVKNKNIPSLKPGEQTVMMKEAVIDYFEESGFLD